MDGMSIKYLQEYSTLKRSKSADAEDSLLDYYPQGLRKTLIPPRQAQALKLLPRKWASSYLLGRSDGL